jgi:hypothetical protein
MCSNANTSISKKCTCKYSDICKARQKLETIENRLQPDLNQQFKQDSFLTTKTVNQSLLNKQTYAEKGNHI